MNTKEKINQLLKASISVDKFFDEIEKLRIVNTGDKYILITQLNALGDAVLSTGFVREVKKLYPNHKIILICGANTQDIWKHCPYTDQIIVFDFQSTNMVEVLREELNVCEYALWDKNIELAFSPVFGDTVLANLFFNYLSFAKQTIGYGEHNKSIYFKKAYYEQTFGQSINYDSFLLTHNIKFPYNMFSDLDKRYYILEKLSGKKINKPLELWNPYIEHKYKEQCKDYIIIGDVGSLQRKLYPYYSEALADINIPYLRLSQCHGGIDEVVSWIKDCRLYLGNDTGLMHVASVFNKPIVVCYAESSDLEKYEESGFLSYYKRFYPISKKVQALRPKHAIDECNSMFIQGGCCHEEVHCIKKIPISVVNKAIKKLL